MTGDQEAEGARKFLSIMADQDIKSFMLIAVFDNGERPATYHMSDFSKISAAKIAYMLGALQKDAKDISDEFIDHFVRSGVDKKDIMNFFNQGKETPPESGADVLWTPKE